MKSIVINLLDQAKAALFSTDRHTLGQYLEQVQAQLAGKVIVDKDALRTLLLAVVNGDPGQLNDLRSARWLFPTTSTIDLLLKQVNEEG